MSGEENLLGLTSGEIVSVLYRPSLRERLPQMADPLRLERVLTLLEKAEVFDPEEEVTVCRDPADDKFFACALAGDATYIVTEDQDILAVGDYKGVRPITAAELVKLIEGN